MMTADLQEAPLERQKIMLVLSLRVATLCGAGRVCNRLRTHNRLRTFIQTLPTPNNVHYVVQQHKPKVTQNCYNCVTKINKPFSK
jgi:hypothetical protein